MRGKGFYMRIDHTYQNVLLQGNAPAASSSGGFANLLQAQMEPRNTLDELFEAAAQKYQVPVNLLKAVGKAESNFNPDTISHAGAQGVMQLMPQTAKSLGVVDAFDPEQNIMGGAKYLSQMLDRYDGDVKLALAAYNAGSGNVAKYGGVPPFKETQNYVKKVMEYAEQSIQAGGAAYPLGTAQQTNGLYTAAEADSMDYFDQILQFDDFTIEDYEAFAELWKASLMSKTSSLWNNASTVNPFDLLP